MKKQLIVTRGKYYLTAGLMVLIFGSWARSENIDPIFAAVAAGDMAVVQARLNANHELINLADRYGQTLLHHAVCDNHKQIVSYLLDLGASVAAGDNRGMTALHHAAENGCLEIAELLVEKGAMVDAVNTMRWTPLHLAALRGHKNMGAYLIVKGANVFAQTSRQLTPYNIAIEYGHTMVQDYLVTAMANSNNKATMLAMVSKKR